MLCSLYCNVILFYLSRGFFTLLNRGDCFYGENSSNILCPNYFPSPFRSKASHNCMDLKCVMLSAKMLSLPFLCSEVTWLILAIIVPQLFTFELSGCAVKILCNRTWSHLWHICIIKIIRKILEYHVVSINFFC